MSRHSPVPHPNCSETSVPRWTPVLPDPDLEEATSEDPTLRTWITSLASHERAAMAYNLEVVAPRR